MRAWMIKELVVVRDCVVCPRDNLLGMMCVHWFLVWRLIDFSVAFNLMLALLQQQQQQQQQQGN